MPKYRPCSDSRSRTLARSGRGRSPAGRSPRAGGRRAPRAAHRPAEHLHLPPVGDDQAHDAADQRGLARAVRAEQPDEAAVGHDEVNAVERLHPTAERLAHVPAQQGRDGWIGWRVMHRSTVPAAPTPGPRRIRRRTRVQAGYPPRMASTESTHDRRRLHGAHRRRRGVHPARQRVSPVGHRRRLLGRSPPRPAGTTCTCRSRARGRTAPSSSASSSGSRTSSRSPSSTRSATSAAGRSATSREAGPTRSTGSSSCPRRTSRPTRRTTAT